MSYFLMLILGVLFVEFFLIFKIIRDTKKLNIQCRGALNVMMSTVLSDDEKGKKVINCAMNILKTTLVFTVKFCLIVLVLSTFLFVVKLFSHSLFLELMEGFSSWFVILVTTMLTLVYVWIRNVIQSKL